VERLTWEDVAEHEPRVRDVLLGVTSSDLPEVYVRAAEKLGELVGLARLAHDLLRGTDGIHLAKGSDTDPALCELRALRLVIRNADDILNDMAENLDRTRALYTTRALSVVLRKLRDAWEGKP